MLKKDKGICIRTVDYSETSQIVTIFARENGKIEAIAKGSRRAKSAFNGAIEIFSLGEMVFAESKGGKLATLAEFGPETAFRGLRGKLFALNCGLFGAELLNSFTQVYDPHPDLFDAFVQFVRDCDESQDQLQAMGLLVVFQLTLLELTGGRPILDSCANCKAIFGEKWGRVFFSNSANGLVCPDCEGSFIDRIVISKKASSCLSDLKFLVGAERGILNEIEGVLISHFTQLMHKPPRTAKFFTEH